MPSCADVAAALLDQIRAIPTVDAHEHLHAEEMRLGRQVDIFLLFHQYLCVDFETAGMPAEQVALLDREDVPLDRKWAAVAPYLDLVRTGSVARPPFAALRRFYGEEDLTADNYGVLTERMRANNTPGLFDRCLREACNIELVLNQNRTMWQNDLFRPILPEDDIMRVGSREQIEASWNEVGEAASTDLASHEALMAALLSRRVSEGMIGIKGTAFPWVDGDRAAAETACPRLLAGTSHADDFAIVQTYLRDRLYGLCGEAGIVVVKHSGVWAGGWSDHTTIRPTNIIPVALKHRNTRFDLFHAGTPHPEDASLIARSFPNVWLNLCWSHLISPRLAEEALDLWLDMAPINRVIGFGGDYWWAVENVYGALEQARGIAARVLARRVASGDISEARALQIAERWFTGNAREVYRV